MPSNKKLIVWILLGCILLIAGFFRLWRLDSVPPGLYPDVAINGNDALDTLATKNFKVFYPENNGREGLFMWLIAFSFWLFGPSIWAMKIVAAAFGILTVFGTYLLTRELFKTISRQSLIVNSKSQIANSEVIALLTSFFLAISFWHVNFSRIGFRAIMMPFFLVFGFYFLFKGFGFFYFLFNGSKQNRARIRDNEGAEYEEIQRNRQLAAKFKKKRFYAWLYFICSGIFFGLGFYSYISYRFVVFILAIVLFCWWLVYEKNRRRFWYSIFYFLLSTFLVVLPLGIYFLTRPADFFGRATNVSIFGQKNPVYELGKSIVLHLGMFNIYGDANWRHNYAGSPALFWPIGVFFLIGLIIAIKEFIMCLRKKDYLRFTVYGLLISWFFFMLLPSFLSSEGAPHALRTLGVIPVVYIFSGLGAFWLYNKLKVFYSGKREIIAFGAIIFLLLFSIASAEFNKYFFQWGQKEEVKNAFAENYLKIGNYLNSLSSYTKNYVLVNQNGVPAPFPDGLPMPAQSPIFIERAIYGRTRAIYLKLQELDQIKGEKNTIIAPLQYDQNLFMELYLRFPGGKAISENGVWEYKL